MAKSIHLWDLSDSFPHLLNEHMGGDIKIFSLQFSTTFSLNHEHIHCRQKDFGDVWQQFLLQKQQ